MKTAKSPSARSAKKPSPSKKPSKKKTSQKLPDKQGNIREYRVGHKKPPTHTQFKPGASGNPEGRPKSQTLSEALREALREGVVSADELAVAILRAVKKGNAKMAALVFERTEGKVPQPISGDPDRPIEVIFRFVDEGVGGSNPGSHEKD